MTRDPQNPLASRPPPTHKQITVWIPTELRDQVDERRKQTGETLSDLVRRLLEADVKAGGNET